MTGQRWCKHCKDYVSSRTFVDHINQHNNGLNSDAIDRKQYTGYIEKGSDNYMICILHQKKVPCPVKNCKCIPFGMIRKSRLKEFIKSGIWKHTDTFGKMVDVPIDSDTRTVTLMGVPIFIKA